MDMDSRDTTPMDNFYFEAVIGRVNDNILMWHEESKCFLFVHDPNYKDDYRYVISGNKRTKSDSIVYDILWKIAQSHALAHPIPHYREEPKVWFFRDVIYKNQTFNCGKVVTMSPRGSYGIALSDIKCRKMVEWKGQWRVFSNHYDLIWKARHEITPISRQDTCFTVRKWMDHFHNNLDFFLKNIMTPAALGAKIVSRHNYQ